MLKWLVRARILIVAVAGLVTWVGAEPAHAQTPIPGNYAPNAFTGMKGAVLPPPGTAVIENGTLFYNTREFVDGERGRFQSCRPPRHGRRQNRQEILAVNT